MMLRAIGFGLTTPLTVLQQSSFAYCTFHASGCARGKRKLFLGLLALPKSLSWRKQRAEERPTASPNLANIKAFHKIALLMV